MISNMFFSIMEITVSMSFIISILLLLSKVFDKKYTSTFKYLMWLIISLRLIIPFNVATPSPIVSVPLSQTNLQKPILNTASVPPNVFAERSIENITNTYAFTGSIIISAWLLGAVIFLIFNIVSYFIYKKNLDRWRSPVISDGIKDILSDICNELNIDSKIKIFKCHNIKSPMLIGFIKPMIVLPIKDFDAMELRFILQHELIHYKRHDIWYKLLLTIANELHWFNPIIYIMVKRANYDLEASCDEKVLQSSDLKNRKIYAETILKIIIQNSNIYTVFSTNFYGGANNMKRRFQNIVNTKKRKTGLMVLSLVMVITTFSGVVFAFNNHTEKTNDINYEDYVMEFVTHSIYPDKFHNYFYQYVGKNDISFNEKENSFYFGDKEIWILYDEDGRKLLQNSNALGVGIFLNVERNSNGDIEKIYEITKDKFTELSGWR